MRTRITPLTWERYLHEKVAHNQLQAIDDYFFISDDIELMPLFPYPFKIDAVITFLCTQGSLKGRIGLKTFEAVAPCMMILPLNEVLQFDFISEDLNGWFNILSKTLAEELVMHIKERMEISISTHAQPVISLDQEELELNLSYYHLVHDTLRRRDNPHLKEAIRYLLLSLYYQQHPDVSAYSNSPQMSKQEETFIRFTNLVKQNYKHERQVKFYAERLGLTPKYLSQIIKEQTGKSANDWIDEYVMLEAKALLKSSALSIQQISNELNFVDQSTFGKYFKAKEGISPKEYRK